MNTISKHLHINFQILGQILIATVSFTFEQTFSPGTYSISNKFQTQSQRHETKHENFSIAFSTVTFSRLKRAWLRLPHFLLLWKLVCFAALLLETQTQHHRWGLANFHRLSIECSHIVLFVLSYSTFNEANSLTATSRLGWFCCATFGNENIN